MVRETRVFGLKLIFLLFKKIADSDLVNLPYEHISSETSWLERSKVGDRYTKIHSRIATFGKLQ